MKTYNYSTLENLFNGVFKVSLMTLALDLIYLASQLPIRMGGFVIMFLLFSQIVALIGSILIGLPVALFLKNFGHTYNITAAIISGIVVFLFVFYYLYDGVNSRHHLKGLVLFSTYGVFCGYAFMKGFNKEVET